MENVASFLYSRAVALQKEQKPFNSVPAKTWDASLVLCRLLAAMAELYRLAQPNHYKSAHDLKVDEHLVSAMERVKNHTKMYKLTGKVILSQKEEMPPDFEILITVRTVSLLGLEWTLISPVRVDFGPENAKQNNRKYPPGWYEPYSEDMDDAFAGYVHSFYTEEGGCKPAWNFLTNAFLPLRVGLLLEDATGVTELLLWKFWTYFSAMEKAANLQTCWWCSNSEAQEDPSKLKTKSHGFFWKKIVASNEWKWFSDCKTLGSNKFGHQIAFQKTGSTTNRCQEPDLCVRGTTGVVPRSMPSISAVSQWLAKRRVNPPCVDGLGMVVLAHGPTGLVYA